jgi:GxxExxY protein
MSAIASGLIAEKRSAFSAVIDLPWVSASSSSYDVIRCAIEVPRLLGPQLLESAYEQRLAFELAQNGIDFKLQASRPLEYKDVRLDCGYRLDRYVKESLIVEIKAVEQFSGIHEGQMLTSMKLADIRL